MKKLQLLLYVLLFSWVVNGQDLQLISSSGGDETFLGLNVQYSVGEPVIFSESFAGYMITQGFHQFDWGSVNVNELEEKVDVSVYPNPIQRELLVKSSVKEHLTFTLTDYTGKTIKQGNLNSYMRINVENYTNGQYVLSVFNKNNQLQKSFTLIKTK